MCIKMWNGNFILRKIYVVFSKLYTIPGLASVSSERTISPRFDACRRGPPKGTAKNGGKANWVPSHNTANPQPQQDLTPPRAKVFCHLDGLWPVEQEDLMRLRSTIKKRVILIPPLSVILCPQ
jgi:hypothetical protein